MDDQAHELRKLVSQVRTRQAIAPSRVSFIDSGPPFLLIVNCERPHQSTLRSHCNQTANGLRAAILAKASLAGANWECKVTSAEYGEFQARLWQRATAVLILVDGSDESLLAAYTALKLATVSSSPANVELVFASPGEPHTVAQAFNRFAATALEHLRCNVCDYALFDEQEHCLDDLMLRMLALTPTTDTYPAQKSIASMVATSL